ncbi:MAG: secretin and TonB N-terminal domain-containing protein [Syntrophales bacterium]
MKNNRVLVTFFLVFLMLFGVFPLVGSSHSVTLASGKIEVSGAQENVGYIKDIAFEKIGGKERITLTVSQPPVVSVGDQAGSSVLVKLENTLVPEEYRRPLGEGKFANITEVFPSQKVLEGKQWVHLIINLKERVPYSVRQEGQHVLIDFNVVALAGKVTPTEGKTISEGKKEERTISLSDKKDPDLLKVAVKEVKSPPPEVKGETPKYTGRKVSLDFQDAQIKSVFRLLSELGGVGIVSGEEVKGNVTVNMKNVPWDQALDTILTIQGLGKRLEGNIVTVMPLERMRKEEAEKRSIEEAKVKAEKLAREEDQKQLIEKGKLRQISIEAKVVEVTTEFSRDLGVEWGYGYTGTWGNRDYGVLMGTGGISSSSTGTVTTLPGDIGLTNSNVAVNFPSRASASAPAVGIILGSSKFILDAKLEALETTGNGKIVSSPKVTTLEGVQATIWQGKEVPVVTPGTGTEPPTVTYKDAKLELTVTPRITPDNEKISVEVSTINKDLDWSNEVSGNPAINTSGVKSNIIVKDGDTFVVGGIYKEIETNLESGVPWLSKIPFLGWLFKSETKTKSKREILVFITTKIIKDKVL